MSTGEKQANSLSCFVCGVANPVGLQLRFYSHGAEQVEAEYIVPEHYQGYPGLVHGGIVAAMLDEICARALMTGENPRFMFTARLELRYRKNVPVGQPLRLLGRALKNKVHAATSHGAIYNAEGELLAEAEALLVNIPADMLTSENAKLLGWRDYEE
ncbi:MAG: PaaI family thioesterase [Anaerolineales bacterium]|nr:MAG: PaaI family thioesterase [Anaerolineales bacterium]